MSEELTGSITAGKVRLETCGITDADWANDPSDRKSISGYAFYKNNSLVSWKATKQRATACSSTEVETYALCDGMKEGMWLKMFFKSCWMSCPHPFPIFCDNQSTLALIDSDSASSRTKHIDVRYHFIRDQVHSVKAFTTGWLTTHENTADIFTKPLPQPLFEKHRRGLGVVPLPA